MYYPSSKNVLSIDFQREMMKKKFPEFAFNKIGGTPTWRGSYTPYDSSVEYNLRIEYIDRKRRRKKRTIKIQVYIESPEIRNDVEHKYMNESLCLYFPYDNYRKTWEPSMFIANVIVPWAFVWIHSYEYWLQTGEWLNDEVKHETGKKKMY